jgi:hypothetical protein
LGFDDRFEGVFTLLNGQNPRFRTIGGKVVSGVADWGNISEFGALLRPGISGGEFGT